MCQQRAIAKPRKRHEKRIRNLTNKKRLRDSLRLWRKENGLTADHGFVKNSTTVLFDDTRHLQSFESHPRPRNTWRSTVYRTSLFGERDPRVTVIESSIDRHILELVVVFFSVVIFLSDERQWFPTVVFLLYESFLLTLTATVLLFFV